MFTACPTTGSVNKETAQAGTIAAVDNTEAE